MFSIKIQEGLEVTCEDPSQIMSINLNVKFFRGYLLMTSRKFGHFLNPPPPIPLCHTKFNVLHQLSFLCIIKCT